MNRKLLGILVIALLFIACGVSKPGASGRGSKSEINYGSPTKKQELQDANTFKVDTYSNDSTYGYTIENPIMVGKSEGGNGPLNERRFLNALMGPNGEPIIYSRLGSCCQFKTKNGLLGDSGFLDKYSIMHKGLDKEVILYINMYDSDVLQIPVGFKKKIK
ncbi:hypothetical protein [Dysgonomonas sp. BGC7]|uniref:hypothetical protein n=1 Tax=Dysgonomonas sp. BGC7 TaxID=1658008 RepID=UPI0006830BE6|nr:hypothetical protein [Dysgonomonas sp. BGC7]MBD8388104.1 2-dehydro-3-deoxyphosphooctonate aldolase [Dysgonomonas sp. BGC7]